MTQIHISEVENNLQYTFKNKAYLEEALRHSSYVNENKGTGLRDNERFEFLGDAVLNLAIGHLLLLHYPEVEEGDLSRMRASLVNESRLASISRSLNLGNHIQLGKGEHQTNGRKKNSILADTFEAIIAAIYIDGGFDTVFNLIETKFSDLIASSISSSSNQDYKSQLQELIQTRKQQIPVYHIVKESGPDHDKTFHVHLQLSELHTEGIGKSKKLAEQEAARKALQQLKREA